MSRLWTAGHHCMMPPEFWVSLRDASRGLGITVSSLKNFGRHGVISQEFGVSCPN